MSRSHGRERVFFYGCGAHHKRGRTVCDNGLVMRVETVERCRAQAIGGDVFASAVVMAVVDGVLTELEPENRGRELERLRAEVAEAERAIGNLTRAIAVGGQLEPLLVELQARQRQRDELRVFSVPGRASRRGGSRGRR